MNKIKIKSAGHSLLEALILISCIAILTYVVCIGIKNGAENYDINKDPIIKVTPNSYYYNRN